jgi:hypothetical protein
VMKRAHLYCQMEGSETSTRGRCVSPIEKRRACTKEREGEGGKRGEEERGSTYLFGFKGHPLFTRSSIKKGFGTGDKQT